MSTRSRVGIVSSENTNFTESIYIHFDGYPEGVGNWLLGNLNNEDDIVDYISEGDRSTFELSYMEWRGEDAPSVYHKDNAWPDYGQEFEYLFDIDSNTWKFRQYGKKVWYDLKNHLTSLS